MKSYLDYGAFTPIQVAATAALNGPDDCIREMREIYKRRRDVLVESFGRAGWQVPAPRASMFAWSPIPEPFQPLGSVEFAKLLVEKAEVAVSPGTGFGERGEGFVRIALVENEQRIRQAARNIRRFLETGAGKVAQRRPARHAALSAASTASRSASSETTDDGCPAESGSRRSRHGRRLRGAADRRAARGAGRRAAAGRSRSSPSRARSRGKDRGSISRGCAGSPIRCGLRAIRGIDVFVELMGGEGDPAKSAVEAALAAGKPVVTANKALLAQHGVALADACREAATSRSISRRRSRGGIPIVKTLREGLGGNRIERVYGILNGTCNYILTRMEQERLSFDDCLKEAQRLGYAEADPTFDIDGFDTAQKLAILASLAFGTEVDAEAIYVEGISSITLADLEAADELGYRVKLLGVAVRTDPGIEQRVHPTMVPKDSAIAQVMGVTNAVAIDADAIAPITLVGPGAGGMATASAVVADIVDIARGVRARAVRPAGGEAQAQRRRRCSATRAATTSACWRSTGPAPRRPSPAAGGAEHLAGIDRAAPPRPRRTAATIRQARECAGAGHSDHLCDHRRRGAQGAAASARQGHSASRK